jgi:hypothetical protein
MQQPCSVSQLLQECYMSSASFKTHAAMLCCCSDEVSYLMLLEAVLLLLVCCSTQLYTQQTAAPLSSQPLLEALMEQQQSASALVGALLQLVVARQPLPPKLQLYVPAADGSGTSVMRLVRTAAGGQLVDTLLCLRCLWQRGSCRNRFGRAAPTEVCHQCWWQYTV